MNTVLPAPGGKLDESLTLVPVRVAVLTISDTRDEESDTSGETLAGRVKDSGHHLAARAIVRDDVSAIRARITFLSSCARVCSRRASSPPDGGSTKTLTTSASACLRSCLAPCQSTSNNTSRPLFNAFSTGFFGVP